MIQFFEYLLLISSFLRVIPIVQNYPNGAPISACITNVPAHLVNKDPSTHMLIDPQTTKSPFGLFVGSNYAYQPGQTLTVTIQSITSTSNTFEGFLLRAVRNDPTPIELMGDFVNCTSDGPLNFLKVVNNNKNADCMTHASDSAKTFVTCQWKAPSEAQGPIIFQASVVVNYQTFFVIQSLPVASTQGISANYLSIRSAITPLELNKSIDLNQCGVDRGCILFPMMCDVRGRPKCSHAVTFKRDGDYFTFDVFARTPGYVALAFSTDDKMGMDELITCSYDTARQTISVQSGIILQYPSSVYRTPDLYQDLGGVLTYNGVGFTNRELQCRFKRFYKLASFNGSDAIMYDLTSSWYVVLATGDLVRDSIQIMKHLHKPLVSKGQIKFTNQIYYFQGLSREVQIHAVLVTIGWLFFHGVGVVLARHTRPLFKQLICGKAIWFWSHVLCMVLAFLFSLAGIIYKTVTFGAWDSSITAQRHGIFGLIATCSAFLNIIAGIFRPDMDTKFRPIFNRLHRWNGVLGLIFATIAMWLGIYITDETSTDFTFWGVIVLGIWTVFQFVAMVAMDILRKRAKYSLKPKSEEIDKSNVKVNGKMVPHINSIVFFIYTGVLAALIIAFGIGLFFN